MSLTLNLNILRSPIAYWATLALIFPKVTSLRSFPGILAILSFGFKSVLW